MTAFAAMLRKEALEIRRTWRLWVIPGILIFFGLVDPILAKIAPKLVESIATDQPGTVIVLPDPVALDAYVQFAKSLTQIVLIALIIASADLVAGERRSGTAILVLTKPLARSAFVLAKVTAQIVLVVIAALLGGAVCWLGTRAIFGEAPLGPLAAAIGVWLVFALLFIAIAALLSVVLSAQAGAAGLGIAIYALLALLAQWGPAKDYTPAGLFAAIDTAIRGGTTGIAWPVVTGLLTAALCLLIAIFLFGRQEIARSSGA